MSAPASRPVHPCVMSLTDGTRGAEYSVWAHITSRDPNIQNLVTASASTLSVYTVSATTGKLQLDTTFHLAGSVISLGVLTAGHVHGRSDGLLVGFAGHARLTVLQVGSNSNNSGRLEAASLLDLTPALQDNSYGAVTVMEQDAEITVLNSRPGLTTVACILGGGVAVAVVEVAYHKQVEGWLAAEPYILPLSSSLSQSLSAAISASAAAAATAGRNANLGQSMATGFGDIISATFLAGYLEPVLVLLHSDPGGRTWCGRLGRKDGEGGAPPLHVTALSVSVVHNRTAVLWSHSVSCDAVEISSFGSTGCLVVGANTLTLLEAGQIQQVIAVNGWARSTCPATLQKELQPNPVVKLAVQLDGSALTWLSPDQAVLALRAGQLYVLQRTVNQWTLLPTGQTLGAVGEVVHLSSFSFGGFNAGLSKLLGKTTGELSMGLLFAGSRLGDSLLLGYALESVKIPWKDKNSTKKELMIKPETGMKTEEDDAVVDNEYDRMLRVEEDALYAPVVATDSGPDLVPPSDEDDDNADEEEDGERKRARIAKFSVVRSLAPLDSLVNLGPLGPSCEGPLSRAPAFLTAPEPAVAGVNASPVFGATAHVFPSGYGSSGGIALATVPGRDDRMILAEADCFSAQCVFSLPDTGVVLMGIAEKAGGGVRVLRLGEPSQPDQEKAFELSEVDLEEWCSPEGISDSTIFASARDVFQSTLLHAGELSSGLFAVLVSIPDDNDSLQYVIVVFQEKQKSLEIRKQFLLKSEADGVLLSVSPFARDESYEDSALTFCCNWSSGNASVVTFGTNGIVNLFTIPGETEVPDDDPVEEDGDEAELERFYQSQKIVSVDIFKAPEGSFDSRVKKVDEIQKEVPSPANQSKIVDEPKMDKEKIVDEPKVDQSKTVDEPKVESVTEVKEWSKLTVVKLKEELKKRGLAAVGKKADLVAVLEESDRELQEEEEDDFVTQEVNQVEKTSDMVEEAPDMVEKAPDMVEEAPDIVEKAPDMVEEEHLDYDGDEEELYDTATREIPSTSGLQSTALSDIGGVPAEETLFIGICRQSGSLEVYSVPRQGQESTLLWASSGCGHGVSSLCNTVDESAELRKPRSHEVSVREIRFFACGPSLSKSSDVSPPRSLCLTTETINGDLHLYALNRGDSPTFQRVALRTVARPSQEQSRHNAKLRRKGIIEKGTGKDTEASLFSYSSLHPFCDVSGQDGLFAAVARPMWLIAERGHPTALNHRMRHAAPAGGKPRPITGFCSGLMNSTSGLGGFLTLHERVGRVGSQRLTAFHGISEVFNSHGLLPGGGLCVEKIPVGVTVRRIQFIDDPNASTGEHPLYAVLVSRELEEDQSPMNDDGNTPEERQALIDEKESGKIKRQVEADLGGFDMESEWVEEIERENCFKIDTDLGGAPPTRRSAYSVWVVDAASNWAVVDSFELGEHEHGMAMQVMNLSDFPEEPGSEKEESTISEEDLESRPFIVVGTGIVDHNGEDVSSKGRVLLFEVKGPGSAARLATSQVAELSLCYEKEIFHGPVTTVGCLNVDGKMRLVFAAGADVNIEQWGNEKLTQIGFFRATMQVLDIMLFKNFFLLSDAYDSMYFLVWRESDKSLTMLAKDYDPITVYAAGVMSRGAAMTFVCHDDRQNLQFFQYAPGEAAARGGNKLVCRADHHLGTQTIAFSSHFCRSSLLVHSATPTSTLSALKQQDSFFGRSDDDQRLGIHFGSTDGDIGVAVPLSEPVYWRLTALQSVMANALDSNCALNPRAWRLYRRTPRRGGCRTNDRKKSTIDGDLVFQFADLALAEQEDLASAIGSTVDLILDNILEVQCASMMI